MKSFDIVVKVFGLFIVHRICCAEVNLYQFDAFLAPTPENQTESPDNELITEFNANNSYCFRFTWLGPEYDNTTPIINVTCKDWKAEKKAKDVPCKQPLVITINGTKPDMDYLWEHYKTRVACKRTRGQACARVSYYFNNAVQNVTYMCARIFSHDEGAQTNDCFTQRIDGIDQELCICESKNGNTKPCNRASLLNQLSFSLLCIVLFLFHIK